MDKVSCSRTQHSNLAWGEAQTGNCSIPSLSLHQLNHYTLLYSHVLIHITVKGVHISVEGVHISVEGVHISVKGVHISVKGVHISMKGVHISVICVYISVKGVPL